MTNIEFKEAADLALNQTDVNLTGEDIAAFDGFGLKDFKPIFCTIRQLARVIRWQCQYLFGGFDSEELQSIARVGKTKFRIIS